MWSWRVTVVVLATTTVATTAGQQQTTWPVSEGLQLSLEEWFRNPTARAIKGLPNLLQDEDATQKEPVKPLSLYLPNPDLVSSEDCKNDTEAIIRVLLDFGLQLQILLEGRFWPLMLPDSWGKLPDGILDGNFQPWGMQEECTGLDVVEDFKPLMKPQLTTSFRGKYCLIKYGKYTFNDTGDTGNETKATEGLWGAPRPTTRAPILMALPGFPAVFHYGTCMPSSCTRDDLQRSLNNVLMPLGKVALDVDCHMEDEQKVFDAAEIFFIVLVSVLGLLLVAGALLDLSINYWNKQHLRKGPLRFLLVFSMYSNMKKIFHINNNEGPEVISCLHGIRVMSMSWVVWGHCYGFFLYFSSNVLGAARRTTDDFIEQTVVNAAFSVDSFFFMSGLLVAYGCLKEFSRRGRMNWFMYYLHRFIRLTPPILLTAGAVATISRFTLVGPMAGLMERWVVQVCRDNWWYDALYINNFFEKACLGQTWYTSVDTQLFIVAPLVLLPLMYRPKLGMIWLGVVTVVALAIPPSLIGAYHLTGEISFAHPEEEALADVDTYTKPWTRAHVYLIGMWCGWLLHTLKGKQLTLRKWQAALGWLLAVTTGLLVVYGVANYNKVYDADPLPLEVAVIYGGFSRPAWACALFWVVLACHKGYGGPVNAFLAHPCWQPPSRLTYALFLIALPIQELYVGMVYLPVYGNHLNMMILCCGMLFIGGIVGLIISLMSEGPVLGLEKLLLPRPGRGLEEASQAKEKPK